MIARRIVKVERKSQVDLRRGQAGMPKSSLNLLETGSPSVRKGSKRSTTIMWPSHESKLVGVYAEYVEDALR